MIGRSLALGGEEAEWIGREDGGERQAGKCADALCTSTVQHRVVPRLVEPVCDQTVVLSLKTYQLVVGLNSNISCGKTFGTLCDRTFHEVVETALSFN